MLQHILHNRVQQSQHQTVNSTKTSKFCSTLLISQVQCLCKACAFFNKLCADSEQVFTTFCMISFSRVCVYIKTGHFGEKTPNTTSENKFHIQVAQHHRSHSSLTTKAKPQGWFSAISCHKSFNKHKFFHLMLGDFKGCSDGTFHSRFNSNLRENKAFLKWA